MFISSTIKCTIQVCNKVSGRLVTCSKTSYKVGLSTSEACKQTAPLSSSPKTPHLKPCSNTIVSWKTWGIKKCYNLNYVLAAAMAQVPSAAMPGVPPQMQQKQIRPELPANIQPKISQRNLLPSDVRPSVSTQTAGGQPKVRWNNNAAQCFFHCHVFQIFTYPKIGQELKFITASWQNTPESWSKGTRTGSAYKSWGVPAENATCWPSTTTAAATTSAANSSITPTPAADRVQ